jgi:hypothetical protein
MVPVALAHRTENAVERYCHPHPPNLEMIVNFAQASAIFSDNFLIFKLRSITEQIPALVL